MDPMLPVYAAIIVLAVVPIVIGSVRSIASLAPSTGVQAMSTKDAYMFPVIASCALFGLFLAFKFLPKDYVNLLLSLYFLVLGVLAIKDILAEYPLMGSWFGYVPALLVVAWYGYTKHWAANNVLGLAFSISAISLMSCGTFRIACLLLWGLFIYDIFWVFGTPVMVSVATQFDAPIKLVIPRPGNGFSMLGLGDIVLPGVLISLMLRFDCKRLNVPSLTSRHIYFWTCLVAYIGGLVTTIGVMHAFHAAQPALLYLVPACTGSIALLAFMRGEWALLNKYSEGNEADAAAEKVQ